MNSEQSSQSERVQTVCLVILATIAVSFSLFYLKSVLLPFVIALFIVIGCNPILEFLEAKLKLSRYVGLFVTFSVGSILLALFSLTTLLSINDLKEHSGAYETRLNAIATWASARLTPSPQDANDADADANTNDADADDSKKVPADSLPGVEQALETDEANQAIEGNQATDAREATEAREAKKARDSKSAAAGAKKALNDLVKSTTEFFQRQLIQIASSLSNLLSYGILILIFVFFLLMGQGDNQSKQPEIIREIETRVRRYLVVKTLISAVTGFVFGLVLWLFGVPLAILFGFLAFLLNFIPNIGPLVSILTPVPFLILNSEMSPTAAIVCFALVSAIQFVSGNVVETRIMGKSFDVSPVVLLLALMFFGLVWGIIGMFMATPIASVIKIVLQQNDATRPLGELMAGRWSTETSEV